MEDIQNRTGMKRQSGGTFIKGILTGGLGVFLVMLLIFLPLMKSKQTGQSPEFVTTGDSEWLNRDAQTKLNTLEKLIEENYYEDVDRDELVTGMYKGLFEGLGDPYSTYYTPEEYEDMMISTNANYYGIGAGLQQDTRSMVVTVTFVYEGSPAEAAGIKPGDEIVKVGEIEGTSMELSELVTHIRGEEGTSVHLEIMREEEGALEFDVERAKVDIPTVEYQMLEGSVGLVQVSEFAENTPEKFEAAINDLTEQGMTKMIVDLRNNGGGLVLACQQMLDIILPEGVVVYTEDKNGDRFDYTSDAERSMDIPIVVLVNENTASASEIFAGAIRDFEYGTIVGTTTFGKGIVQTIQKLPDGSAVKITTAKYYTPNGDNIHGTGITPDVEAEYKYLGDEEGDYDPMMDSQVLKALEVLR